MITVQVQINAPLEKVWDYFNGVEHYQGWSFASPEWGAKGIENTLAVGGKIKVHNYAKDNSMEFYFEGEYTKVELYKILEFTLSDGRRVRVEFEQNNNGVVVRESFDPEQDNPVEYQKAGWQAYLDNFKSYTESHR
jgi:uncharacterized protein YndB with AHSA1/START domain